MVLSKTRKGKLEPVFLIQSFFTAMLIIGIVTGIVGRTGQFVKQETVQVQAERAKNAALAVSAMQEGYVTVDISGYEFRYDDGESNVYVKFRDKIANASVGLLEGSVADVQGPADFTMVEDSEDLIVIKDDTTTGYEIRFEVGEPRDFDAYDKPDSDPYSGGR